jgi:hypothetical protein
VFSKGKGDFLFIEDKSQTAVPLFEKDIDKLLSNLKTLPKVVLLMACHSEEIGKVFLKYGVTHVICVKKQNRILDKACEIFSRTFYRFLFDIDNSYTPCEAFKLAKLEVER